MNDHRPSDERTPNERWYDDEIAPALVRLCNLCHERGMSFISVVEYEHGSQAKIYRFTDSAGLAMIMTNHCAQTAPNIDGFVIGLKQYCDENGIDTSASIVMRLGSGT